MLRVVINFKYNEDDENIKSCHFLGIKKKPFISNKNNKKSYFACGWSTFLVRDPTLVFVSFIKRRRSSLDTVLFLGGAILK